MGNFTSIEQEFNTRITPEINRIMQSQSNNTNPQNIQNIRNNVVQNTLFEMREQKMQERCSITGGDL